VTLMVFYLAISLGYLALARINFHASQVVVPFVVVLLLAPAVYGEVLRVKAARRRGPR
jgi:ABC-type molybdate transport system permease subunit